MKKNFLALFILVVFLSICSGPAFAAFELEIITKEISTCPTILKGEPPLNKNDIQIFITNLYQYSDTFDVKLTLPEKWSGFAALDDSIASGKRKQIEPFWITVPDVNPGIYPIKLEVESKQTAEKESKTFNIKVLSCHNVELTVSEAQKTICLESNEPITYELTLKNLGKDKETFELSGLKNGQKLSWITSQNVSLEPNEVKTVQLHLNPPVIEGEQKIIIQAKSLTSYAKKEVEISLNIKKCHDFSLEIDPKQKTGCIEKSVDFNLLIKNLAEKDSYEIITPKWIQPEIQSFEIDKGDKKVVSIHIEKVERGLRNFNIIVRSKNAKISKSVEVSVEGKDCSNVAVIAMPNMIEVCEDSKEPLIFDLGIKNMGTVEDTFEVTTTAGSLDINKFKIAVGQTRYAKLTVYPKDIKENTIKIIAKNNQVQDETMLDIVFVKCYSAFLLIVPSEISACPSSEIKFSAVLKNTGKLADNYKIVFNDIEKTTSLEAGESALFNFSYKLPLDAIGERTLDVLIKSEHIFLQKALKIKLDNACYITEVSDGKKEITVRVDSPTEIPIKIKNKGSLVNIYKFNLTAPDFIYLSENELKLEPGEEQNIYLYASPELDLQGNFEANLKITGQNFDSNLKININVRVNETKNKQSDENQTSSTNIKNQSIENQSVGNQDVSLTASVTGKAFSAVPFWKAVAIGVITLVIILILVVKFASFMKV